MSGTSSSRRSSTSGRGNFSSSRFERTDRGAAGHRCGCGWPRNGVGQLADALLVGAPDHDGRGLRPPCTSFTVTTSPMPLRGTGIATTLRLSLSTTSAPRSSSSWSIVGMQRAPASCGRSSARRRCRRRSCRRPRRRRRAAGTACRPPRAAWRCARGTRAGCRTELLVLGGRPVPAAPSSRAVALPRSERTRFGCVGQARAQMGDLLGQRGDPFCRRERRQRRRRVRRLVLVAHRCRLESVLPQALPERWSFRRPRNV